MIPTRYNNAELAEERYGALARDYAAALSATDALADAALRALDALGDRGPELFQCALAAGIDAVGDAPPELRALFEDLEAPPFEVDRRSIDLGARALGRCGLAYTIATKQGLYWGFYSGAAVKAVAFTGELKSQEEALRRLAETAAWTLCVVRPGQLEREAAGWQATVRVRLVHAWIRSGIRRTDRWDDAALGAPVSMGDQAMALLQFCYLPLRMLALLGFRFSVPERDGIYSLWRYVGHLVGVPASLNPAGEADCRRLLDLIELTNDPPDDDSIALIGATLRSTGAGATTHGERLFASVSDAVERTLAWHHFSSDHLERVQFPPTRVGGVVPALAAAVCTVEALRCRIRVADTPLTAVNNRLTDDLIVGLKRRAARTVGGAPRHTPIEQTSPGTVIDWRVRRRRHGGT